MDRTLCACIIGPTVDDCLNQLKAVENKANLVELRIDLIPQEGVEEIMAYTSLPWLLTWVGATEEQLLGLARLTPAYLSVEDHYSAEFIAVIRSVTPTTRIILSHHDFQGMPDIPLLLQHNRTKGADLYKVAVTPTSTTEALTLLDLGADVIPVPMGSLGTVVRILSPFTFAAVEKAIAPGQLMVDTLIEVYRYHQISDSTGLYGLIGSPIDKTTGYLVHNVFMAENGLDSVYVKMEVASEELERFLPLAHRIGFRGLSVTMPLKQAIIPFIEDLSGMAIVNTLTALPEGGYRGTNTDAAGALDALGEVKGKRIVILGAGGAALAIRYEAMIRGATVTLLSRNNSQADDTLDAIEELSYDILINATPNPMPILESSVLPGSVVMDITINPVETELLLAAKMRGCHLVYGYEMFVRQAVGQLQTWLGKEITTAAVQSSCEMALCLH